MRLLIDVDEHEAKTIQAALGRLAVYAHDMGRAMKIGMVKHRSGNMFDDSEAKKVFDEATRAESIENKVVDAMGRINWFGTQYSTAEVKA